MPSAAPVSLHDTVATRLRRVNQRMTGNRVTLVEVLAETTRPLTIPEILEARPALAQSSVYRNLVVLEQAGVVHRIVTDHEFARYELAEDLTEHHHHLVCVVCGRVEDVPASPGVERAVAAAGDDLARTTGFRTLRHRVDLIGLCRDCG